MLNETQLAFIGSGIMAEAIIKVILNKKLIPPKQIIGSGLREQSGQELRDRYGIETTTNNREAARTADIGRTMATIAAGLKHAAIVRAMPNTSAQIGEGMTVWTATPEVNERQQAQAQTILKAMGQKIYVAEERALDMATAMSGTGPTYVFLMMETMIDAALD